MEKHESKTEAIKTSNEGVSRARNNPKWMTVAIGIDPGGKMTLERTTWKFPSERTGESIGILVGSLIEAFSSEAEVPPPLPPADFMRGASEESQVDEAADPTSAVDNGFLGQAAAEAEKARSIDTTLNRGENDVEADPLD